MITKVKTIPFPLDNLHDVAVFIGDEMYVAKKLNDHYNQCEQCNIQDDYCKYVRCGVSLVYKKIKGDGV